MWSEETKKKKKLDHDKDNSKNDMVVAWNTGDASLMMSAEEALRGI